MILMKAATAVQVFWADVTLHSVVGTRTLLVAARARRPHLFPLHVYAYCYSFSKRGRVKIP